MTPISDLNKKLRPAAMNSLLFSALSVLLLAASAAAQSPLVLRPPEPGVQAGSLLKTNVTYQGHNQRIPWQKESPGSRRGLGVVLEGNRVLVTGQMVADATYIELELPESGQKIPARVEAVDYEANLALLAPAANGKEAAFFAGLRPMALDSSARIGDALHVWQTGRVGELIVTPMLVSKVMNQGYVVDNASFLVYEAQGIIRSEANSFTLPVVKGGKLAGLLLRYDSKNQVATVLPGPIIEHFLKDVAQAPYDGFPSLGVEFQTTLDEQFREYLGLKPDQPGVYISKVVKGASAERAGVREGDILLAINGERIDARGDYQDKQYGALSISHVVRGRAFIGEEVEICRKYLEIEKLRLGERLSVTWDLRTMPADALVPSLLLQPLLENAVHHGIEPSPRAGTVGISIGLIADRVVVEIVNTLDPSVRPRSGNQVALSNIRERLLLLYDSDAVLKTTVLPDKFSLRLEFPCRKERRRQGVPKPLDPDR